MHPHPDPFDASTIHALLASNGYDPAEFELLHTTAAENDGLLPDDVLCVARRSTGDERLYVLDQAWPLAVSLDALERRFGCRRKTARS